jgi:hypothetical protein
MYERMIYLYSMEGATERNSAGGALSRVADIVAAAIQLLLLLLLLLLVSLRKLLLLLWLCDRRRQRILFNKKNRQRCEIEHNQRTTRKHAPNGNRIGFNGL